jgi:hypothetical protein
VLGSAIINLRSFIALFTIFKTDKNQKAKSGILSLLYNRKILALDA